MSFGEKLANLRKEHHMSQEELASLLNVSRQAVSKWESNGAYPETKQIVAICKLFECSMDELIGVKETKDKSDKSILKKLDNVFDEFIQGIKLFFNMTFKQKCKCILELGALLLVLIILYFIIDVCLMYVLEKILYIIPIELLVVLLEMLDGLFTLVFIIFIIYSLIKLYKIRYLDCYKAYNEEIKVVANEEKMPQVNIKEEKVIIRDRKNTLSVADIIYRLVVVMLKIMASFLIILFIIAFIFILISIVLLIYYAGYSLIIVYLAIFFLGMLILAYVLLELLIKYLFNVKQKLKHLYILFIISLLVMGIGGGLFAVEISKIEVTQEESTVTEVYRETFSMQDNLIMFRDGNTEYIFEDRDDIEIVVYSDIDSMEVYSSLEEEYTCINNLCEEYTILFTSYYEDTNFMEEIEYFLNNLKDYKIKYNSNVEISRIVYISEKNYKTILQNIDSYINFY